MKQNKEQDTDKYACYSSLNVCFLLRHRKKVPATNLHAVNSDRFERPQWLTVPEVYHSSIPQRVALLIKSSSPWKGHWRFHVTHLRYAGAGPFTPCDLVTLTQARRQTEWREFVDRTARASPRFSSVTQHDRHVPVHHSFPYCERVWFYQAVCAFVCRL